MASATGREPQVNSTLSKGCAILEHLIRARQAKRVSEISRELGLTKSNTFRLLQTLMQLGYVRQDAKRHYAATLKTWQVGRAYVESLNLRKLAAPEMVYLAEQTDETVYLAVPEDFRVIYIDKIDSPKPIRSWNPVGGEAPIHCVSFGKCIIATNYDAFRSKFSEPLPRFTDRSITTFAKLDTDVQATRARGYAHDRGEFRDRVEGFASAIILPDGEAVGSIGVSLPDVNLAKRGEERTAALVVHAAASITRKLARN